MIDVIIYEYGTNEIIDGAELEVLPRVGEYFLMTDKIDIDWKDHFYIVRGVTHTKGGEIAIHVEKQNLAEIEQREKRMNEMMKKLNDISNRVKPNTMEI